MRYIEVPPANPGQDGICSDNECPCGSPGARIPRGTGYMYISKAVVEFRKDALTVDEVQAKIQMVEKQMMGFVLFAQDTVSPTLMCEQGARKRGLDLEVAAADAKYWWETGYVPLHETPLVIRKVDAQPAVQQTAIPQTLPPQRPVVSQPTPVAPVVSYQPTPAPQPRAPVIPATGAKSPVLAAVLSFFLLGGGGQIYLGQWKKGLALMAASFILSFALVGFFVNLLGAGDAYGTAKKMNEGFAVGEWQFNINWKSIGIAFLLMAMAVFFISLIAALFSR